MRGSVKCADVAITDASSTVAVRASPRRLVDESAFCALLMRANDGKPVTYLSSVAVYRRPGDN